MNNIEKIIKIFEVYYTRDDTTKKERKEYLEHQNEYDFLCEETYNAILEIEKEIKIKVSEYFKYFLKSKSGLYISNNMTSDEFRFYDAKELYEFNYIGEKVGYSAIEELKDFLIVGQDEGECSYFFDVHNTLGRGIDTFWRVDRNDCEDFEIVGSTFIEFLDTMASSKEIISDTVQDNKNCTVTVENYKKELSRKIPEKRLQKLNNDIQAIKNYVDKIRKKDDLLLSEEYWDESAESLIRMQKCMADSYPAEFVYVLLNLRYFAFTIGNVAIEALILESFEKFNMGKRAKKHLHDVLVFALNKGEAYKSDWDFVFVDYKNILGNGSDAIYIISEKSKKLEEACYVAKDIVDLFRIFAEGGEHLVLTKKSIFEGRNSSF